MGRNRMEQAVTRPRQAGLGEHWPPAVPVSLLSRSPDDRTLHHLAVAYGHIDELQISLFPQV